MAQFFFLLISIGVLALLLVGGANYMQPSANTRIEMRDKMTAALQTTSSAYRSYKVSNRTVPAVSTTDSDYAPWTNYFAGYAQSAISLKYSSATYTGQPLFYQDATNGYHFCFIFLQLQQAQYNGLIDASNQFPVNTTVTPNQKSVVVSQNNCHARSDTAVVPASWPADVSVTLWPDYQNGT